MTEHPVDVAQPSPSTVAGLGEVDHEEDEPSGLVVGILLEEMDDA